MKFKVGDRVEFVKFSTRSIWYKAEMECIGTTGEVGIVRRYEGDQGYDETVYNILFKSTNRAIGLFESQIEHPRVKHTRLAEKMYPSGKKEGDWWILK